MAALCGKFREDPVMADSGCDYLLLGLEVRRMANGHHVTAAACR